MEEYVVLGDVILSEEKIYLSVQFFNLISRPILDYLFWDLL